MVIESTDRDVVVTTNQDTAVDAAQPSKSSEQPWFVYVLECVDGSLYTGISTDVARRFKQHCSGKGARYTRGRTPVRVLASFRFETQSLALRAEIRIKKLSAAQKRALCLQAEISGLL